MTWGGLAGTSGRAVSPAALRLLGPLNVHLAFMAWQGCYPDTGQRPRVHECALNLLKFPTTLQTQTANIIQQTRHTACVGTFAPHGADVFRPDGRYVGFVHAGKFADICRPFDA